jgi:hypothetical protein
MAREFPHAEVLGLDLGPGPADGTPPNCRFLAYDINSGLSQFHGMYDLIHCRFSGWGVWNLVLLMHL